MNCAKCGSPRFGYNQRYQSYCCPMCKYEDKSMILPTEATAYRQWSKFMRIWSSENESQNNMPDFTYDKFKEYMSKYIAEEVRPAQDIEKKQRRERTRKDAKKQE